MKKIMAILLVVIMAVALASCKHISNSLYEDENAKFELIEKSFDYKILRHKETGVYYLLYEYKGSYRNGITVMLNADGTPYTGGKK